MRSHIPTNLSKLTRLDIVQRLTIGDPYTFIVPEPLTAEHPTDERMLIMLNEHDLFAKSYASNEPPRVFKIIKITWIEKDASWAYETVFVGFRVLQEVSGGLSEEILITSLPPKQAPKQTPKQAAE